MVSNTIDNFTTTPLKVLPMTATPKSYPQGWFKDKVCGWCETTFSPQGPSHLYCSEMCKKQVNSDKHYKRRYGVGLRWVQQKLDEQNWLCAICNTTPFKMREDHVSGLNLDHCHITGKPRALLCHNCNRGLGLFQDDPAILRAAALYVEYHNDLGRNEESA